MTCKYICGAEGTTCNDWRSEGAVILSSDTGQDPGSSEDPELMNTVTSF